MLLEIGIAIGVWRLADRARKQQLTARSAALFAAALLLFPYAWYLYGAVYADALFVLCAIGAFYLVEKDRPVLAGLVAAVATATRPVGIAMVIGLVAVLDLFSGVELDGIGVLWALGAMVGAASYFVLSADEDNGLPPLALAGGGLLVAAVLLGALGAVGALPLDAGTDDAV